MLSGGSPRQDGCVSRWPLVSQDPVEQEMKQVEWAKLNRSIVFRTPGEEKLMREKDCC